MKLLESIFPDNSHVFALTNISRKKKKITDPNVNTTQSFKNLFRIRYYFKFSNHVTL